MQYESTHHPGRGAASRGEKAPTIDHLSSTRLIVGSLLAALIPMAVAALLARFAFGFTYSLRGLIFDALGLWLLAFLVLWATRSLARTMALSMLTALLFVTGQAISLAMLGTPARLADVLAIPTLMSVMPGGRRITAYVGLAVAGLLVLWLLRTRWTRLTVLLLGLAVLGSAFVPGSLAHRLALRMVSADVEQHSADRIKRTGSLTFVLAENADRHIVGEEDVSRIVGDSTWQLAYDGPRRNIHLVLLETFWDPLRLTHYGFSEDPFDPRFRTMVEQSKGSMALTPHFGHLTANAEFESLCGLPATEHGAIFVNSMHNPMPCLPRILGSMGYQTQASHANTATSWGRDKAYAKMGFSRFNSALNFEIDDTDELFLTDASFYRQNIEALDRESGPLFNYLVSLSSHWPYKRNKQVRPDLITIEPADDLLRDYANGLRYSSAAFVDWAEEVLRRDPDALIIAYGDHAPVMPPAQEVYFRSGYPMGDHGRLSDEQLLELSGTPLLVIDGRNGVRPVGTMPVSALPDLILDVAFGGQVRLPQSQVLQASVNSGMQARRYLGRMLVGQGGQWDGCDQGEAPAANKLGCNVARRLLQQGETLREDMTEGDSHFTQLVDVPDNVMEDRAKMELTTVGCGIEVASFGPKDIELGKGFNVQKASGKSALWFNFTSRRGKPRIRVERDEVALDMNGLFGAAAWAAPRFIHTPGEHTVYVVCDGMDEVAIGSVRVVAPGRPPQTSKNWRQLDIDFQIGLAPRLSQLRDKTARLEAWAPEALCTMPGWRGPVRIAWSIPGASVVRLFVRSSDAGKFELFSSGSAEGEATTGEWGHEGMQVRIEREGQVWGEFTVTSDGCQAVPSGV